MERALALREAHMTAEEARPGTAGVDVEFRVGFGTDRGLRREINEDSFAASDPLFSVADGMGGHEAGEVASGECIRVLSTQRVLSSGSREATASHLQQILRHADARIRELANARAGTTVSGAVVVEEQGVLSWLVFNVGDSRTYRFSHGKLSQISVDHSQVQELVAAGLITPEEALVHPRRHVVTRALGTGSDAEVDFWLVPVEDGDRLLVCSDGLSGELDERQIQQILATVPHPQEAVDTLIQAALRSGGRDNITVVVVDASSVTLTVAGETPTRQAVDDIPVAFTAPYISAAAECDSAAAPRHQEKHG